MVCDVLASEQGPLCKSMEQIPDLKVIKVRFFPGAASCLNSKLMNYSEGWKISKSRLEQVSHSHCCTVSEGPAHPPKVAKDVGPSSSPSKLILLSLSIADMIKLGKIDTKQAETTVLRLFTYNMDILLWYQVPMIVEFNEQKEPFGKGGFRSAYKATTKNNELKGTTWVIKRYLPLPRRALQTLGSVQNNTHAKWSKCTFLPGTLQQRIVEKHAV